METDSTGEDRAPEEVTRAERGGAAPQAASEMQGAALNIGFASKALSQCSMPFARTR